MPTQNSAPWWNDNYLYRQNLEIVAPAGEAIPAGYTCTIDVNTATLESASKVLANRNDWRVVYYNGSTNTELDRVYVGASETHFKIQAEIAAAATDYSYYVYYKYDAATAAPADYNDVYWWGDDFEDGNISGWTNVAGTWTASGTSPLSGTYSIRCTTTATAQGTVTATSATRLVLSLKYRATDVSGNIFDFMYNSGFVVTVVVSDTFLVHGVPPSTPVTLSDNTAYVIKLVANLGTSTVDVYVDDVLKGSAMAIGSGTSINKVQLRSYGSGDTTQFDNIFVAIGMATAPTVSDGTEYSHVGATKATAWDMAGIAYGSKATTWDMKQLAYDTQATAWDLHVQSSGAKATAWNLLNIIGATKDTAWDMLSTGFTKATSWDIRQRVKSSQATSWDMGGVAHATKQTTWGLIYTPHKERVLALGYTNYTVHIRTRPTDGRLNMLRIPMVEGDEGPNLVFTIKQNDTAVALDGAGVAATFTMRLKGAADDKYSASCTSLNSSGQLTVPFTAASLNTAGEYLARIKIAGLANGTQSTEKFMILVQKPKQ